MSEKMSPLSFPKDASLLNNLYHDLFDEQLVAKVAATPWEPTEDEPLFLLRYKADDGQLLVVALLQFKIAVGIAALLTRHPLSLVEEVWESGAFTAELQDNLRETMNISAAFFNRDYYRHVLFQDLKFTKLSEVEPEFKKIIQNPIGRLNVKLITENDYGEGYINYYQASE